MEPLALVLKELLLVMVFFPALCLFDGLLAESLKSCCLFCLKILGFRNRWRSYAESFASLFLPCIEGFFGLDAESFLSLFEFDFIQLFNWNPESLGSFKLLFLSLLDRLQSIQSRPRPISTCSKPLFAKLKSFSVRQLAYLRRRAIFRDALLLRSWARTKINKLSFSFFVLSYRLRWLLALLNTVGWELGWLGKVRIFKNHLIGVCVTRHLFCLSPSPFEWWHLQLVQLGLP